MENRGEDLEHKPKVRARPAEGLHGFDDVVHVGRVVDRGDREAPRRREVVVPRRVRHELELGERRALREHLVEDVERALARRAHDNARLLQKVLLDVATQRRADRVKEQLHVLAEP
eukprot:Amastigsp_a676848_41.p6 type:complete len:116 gc:universal Amastigsp_a676848_41:842-495(-)